MKKLLMLLLFIALFLISPNISKSQCGVQRWAVKTLTDKDTTKIDFDNVIKTTIKKQIKMKKPKKITMNMRRMKSESKVYELEAFVVEYKKEADRDYHVLISDSSTGASMVIEILDPECPGISSTSRYNAFKKVRDWFTNQFHPTTDFKFTRKRVKLTGVGFFDFVHGQRGMAANGREIHPILKMEYVR